MKSNGELRNKRRKGFSGESVQRHIKQEKSLKTPKDEARVREAQELDRQHREWLEHSSWDEIAKKISEVGVNPGSQKYKEIRDLYRECNRSQRGRRRTQGA